MDRRTTNGPNKYSWKKAYNQDTRIKYDAKVDLWIGDVLENVMLKFFTILVLILNTILNTFSITDEFIVEKQPWNIPAYAPLQAVEQKPKSTEVRPVLDYID